MIEYITHSGSDNLIANIARLSMTEDSKWLELPEGYSEDKRNSLIRYLADNKHTSPFRHNSICIKGTVPLFIARQLGKHQVGLTWNEKSMRYREDPAFWVPREWREAAPNVKQGSGGAVDAQTQLVMDDVYNNVLDVTEGAYQYALDQGICKEQARMMLPQSMQVEFVWTGSLMAFAHVYTLRIDGHAQKEAQDFARALDKIIRPLFPVAWDKLTKEPECRTLKQDAKQLWEKLLTTVTKSSPTLQYLTNMRSSIKNWVDEKTGKS